MSYILDALKKSEKEQKNNKLNILSGDDMLLAEPVDVDSSFKRWIMLLSLTFVFLAILLVLAWFLFTIKNNNQADINNSVSNGNAAINQQPLSTQVENSQSPPSNSDSVTNVENTPNKVNNNNTSENIAPQNSKRNNEPMVLAGSVKSNDKIFSSPEEVIEPKVEPEEKKVDQTIAVIETGLPDAVNQLEINVLSFAPVPERRFVMMNNKSYKEQSEVDLSGNKAKIVEIRQDGVVIDYQGKHYLKRP